MQALQAMPLGTINGIITPEISALSEVGCSVALTW